MPKKPRKAPKRSTEQGPSHGHASAELPRDTEREATAAQKPVGEGASSAGGPSRKRKAAQSVAAEEGEEQVQHGGADRRIQDLELLAAKIRAAVAPQLRPGQTAPLRLLMKAAPLAGQEVQLRSKKAGDVLLTGVVNAQGTITCSCHKCKADSVSLSASRFEEHGGIPERQPASSIYLAASGVSLKDLLVLVNSKRGPAEAAPLTETARRRQHSSGSRPLSDGVVALPDAEAPGQEAAPAAAEVPTASQPPMAARPPAAAAATASAGPASEQEDDGGEDDGGEDGKAGEQGGWGSGTEGDSEGSPDQLQREGPTALEVLTAIAEAAAAWRPEQQAAAGSEDFPGAPPPPYLLPAPPPVQLLLPSPPQDAAAAAAADGGAAAVVPLPGCNGVRLPAGMEVGERLVAGSLACLWRGLQGLCAPGKSDKQTFLSLLPRYQQHEPVVVAQLKLLPDNKQLASALQGLWAGGHLTRLAASPSLWPGGQLPMSGAADAHEHTQHAKPAAATALQEAAAAVAAAAAPDTGSGNGGAAGSGPSRSGSGSAAPQGSGREGAGGAGALQRLARPQLLLPELSDEEGEGGPVGVAVEPEPKPAREPDRVPAHKALLEECQQAQRQQEQQQQEGLQQGQPLAQQEEEQHAQPSQQQRQEQRQEGDGGAGAGLAVRRWSQHRR